MAQTCFTMQDIAECELKISLLATRYPVSPHLRAANMLLFLVAMAKRDDSQVKSVINGLRRSGLPVEEEKIVSQMKRGYDRVLPRHRVKKAVYQENGEDKRYENELLGKTILRNNPNPFNPSTILEYVLPAEGNISMDVFGSAGNRICRLAEGWHQPGKYTVEFKPGADASAGVYHCVLTTEYGSVSRMILYVK
jgi:hypothetical protein